MRQATRRTTRAIAALTGPEPFCAEGLRIPIDCQAILLSPLAVFRAQPFPGRPILGSRGSRGRAIDLFMTEQRPDGSRHLCRQRDDGGVWMAARP
jgi:hypothetical protein